MVWIGNALKVTTNVFRSKTINGNKHEAVLYEENQMIKNNYQLYNNKNNILKHDYYHLNKYLTYGIVLKYGLYYT